MGSAFAGGSCPVTAPEGCVDVLPGCIREYRTSTPPTCWCESCGGYDFSPSGDRIILWVTLAEEECELRSAPLTGGQCPPNYCTTGTLEGTWSQEGISGVASQDCPY